MKKSLSFMFSLVLFWGAACALPALTLEEAGKELGSDNPELREEAERTLRGAGMKALAVVEPLCTSDDETVSTKARYVRAWILLGMDDSLAPALRNRVFGIRGLSMMGRKVLIDDLTPHPKVLIHLHTLLLRMDLDTDDLRVLEDHLVKTLAASLLEKPFDAAQIEIGLLGPDSLAVAVEGLGARPDEEFQSVYREWVAASPEITKHLGVNGWMLEISRLKEPKGCEPFEFPEGAEERVPMAELLKRVLESDLEKGYRSGVVLAFLKFPEIEHLLGRELNSADFLKESELMWREGNDEACLKLFELSFWLTTTNSEELLGEFPAMAKLHGILDEVLQRLEDVVYYVPEFELKKAYLLHAAERYGDALQFSSKAPGSILHRLLVIEAGACNAAVELEGDDEWKAWSLYHGGDVAGARELLGGVGKKCTVLRLLLDEHESLIDEGIETNGSGASGTAFAIMLGEDQMVFEKVVPKVDEWLDRGEEVSKRWLDCLFEDQGRIPNRDDALRIAERLEEAGDGKWAEQMRAYQAPKKRSAKASRAIRISVEDITVRTPKPSGHADPKVKEFGSVDVVEWCLKQWRDGDEQGAQQVMRSLCMRLIFDRELRNELVSVAFQEGRMISSGSGTELEIAVVSMCRKGFPSALARPALEAIALLPVPPGKFYLRDRSYIWLAKALSRHGSDRQALAAMRTFWGGNLGEKCHYNHIELAALLAQLELTVALNAGEHDLALAAAERHLVGSPFRPIPLATALERFRKAEELKAVSALDSLVTAFWEEKLNGLPNCGDYRNAFGAWMATVGDRN